MAGRRGGAEGLGHLLCELPDGRGLRFRAEGEGLPLWLLPGIEGDPRVFCRLDALAGRHPCRLLRLPDEPDIPAMARRLLARGGEARFAVFGTSLGGLVGRELARQAPERVAGLAALGSLPAERHRPRGLALAAALLGGGPEGLLAARYRRRIARRHREEGVDPELSALLLRDLPAPGLLARRLRAIAAWEAGPPPTAPTLWLRGQLDTEAPWSTAEAAADLPGALVETVPGGHRAVLTHPLHLVAVLGSFLRGLVGPA